MDTIKIIVVCDECGKDTVVTDPASYITFEYVDVSNIPYEPMERVSALEISCACEHCGNCVQKELKFSA